MSLDEQNDCVFYSASAGDAGIGLFAAEPISPGQEVLSIRRPLIEVVETSRLKDTCSNCFAWVPKSPINSRGSRLEGVKLKQCTGCRTVAYCGKACQTESWKTRHKYECKLFAKVFPNIFPTALRAVLQLLLLREKGAWSETEWQSVLRLQDHVDDFRRAGKSWQSIALMSKGAHVYSGTSLREDHVQALLGRVLTNSLTLVTPTYDPVGICLDPLAASSNHSCEYNTVVTFDGPQVSMRSLRDIPKDEEITISYIDCTNSISIRQSELSKRYFFTCNCPKCTSGPTQREDVFLNTEISRSEAEAAEAEGFSLLEDANQSADHLTAFNKLEYAMQFMRKRSHLWSFDRQPWPSMRQRMSVSCISLGKWDLALGHSLRTYFDVDPILFPPPFHPVRLVHKWTLTMLVLHISQLSAEKDPSVERLQDLDLNYGKIIWGLMIEVENNVDLSHGPKSTFAGIVKEKFEEIRTDMTRKDNAKLHFSRDDLDAEWKKLREVASQLGT
ncbi:SET domain-containing protein [Xylona heveae TC161]|uniref:SET domain-containing protein n=1 Tax=Xylona heveae (strain CBS 132557 / TC161) TaxID=1328760 RepID=A0A165HP74_XYLHT|nr:SET domain-containing protein [Xylona heveae TC161]KZF23795.1 SET domain-containing protein [Xylona heveae TC161]